MRFRQVTAIGLALLLPSTGCWLAVRNTPSAVAVVAESVAADPIPLPGKAGALRFAVIGDFGSGEELSYQLADRVWQVHQEYPLDFVITVGDNMYGAERPQDFERKFEIPYRPLLDDGVEFYASLGNHDSREQRFYEPFNLDGKLYHSFRAPREPVRFFVLDSTYPVPEQIAWLQGELERANERWKIAYFHHPLYSSGERHGSHVKLRQTLEPLFVEHGVSVVFTGHDHFYERIEPQKGIVHFVVGSGGKLRVGNIDRPSPLTAAGFDDDLAFLVAEISGDQMVFQAITRTGQIVDSGIIERRGAAE